MKKQSFTKRAFTLATSTRRRSYKSLSDSSAFTLADLTHDQVHDPLSLQMNAHSTRRSTQAKKPRTNKTNVSFLSKMTSGTKTAPENMFWDTPPPEPPALTKASLSLSPTEKKALDAFQDAGQRRQRMREELNHFCTETSFTALVRIYNASSWARRLGWLLVVVSMFSWLTVQCYWLLDKYFSYPMEVKIGMVAARELEFPSVTVCNLNPIRENQIKNVQGFKPLTRYTDLIKDDDYLYKNYKDKLWSSTPAPPWTGTTAPPLPAANDTGSITTSPSETLAGITVPHPPANETEQQQPPSPSRESRKKRSRSKRGAKASNQKPPLGSSSASQRDPWTVYSAVNGGQEAEWLGLEREIFSEVSVNHGRHRRSPSSSEQKEHLRNISYNKWDTLDNSSSYYQTRGVEYRVAMAYATLAAKLPPGEVKRSGHDLREFLITCYFDGYQCSPRNFSYFHNHKYGNCYTFNSWKKKSETLYSKFSGPEHGLTLEFNLQQKDYVPALAAEAGVRVVVHPKGSAVFPEDDGVSIQPAHSTSVGIAMETISRLGPPHGSCDDQDHDMDLYVQRLNLTYRKLSCLKSCYQKVVQHYCNCSLPMYFVEDRSTVCNMTLNEVDACTSRLPTTVAWEYDECDKLCPQPCSEVHYSMTVSSAAWPSDAYEDYMKTKVKQSNYLLMDKEIDDSDFAKLNVYFMDLIYTKVEQQRGYESQNLISDIGGQLGLWLGLSAITIGELCGLMLTLFRSLTTRGPRGRSVGNTPIKPFSTLQSEEGHRGLGGTKGNGVV